MVASQVQVSPCDLFVSFDEKYQQVNVVEVSNK